MVTIFVAEDDMEIRALIIRVLSEYVLTVASSYDEAVSCIQKSQNGWDVAVLDGAIPRQGDGYLLAGFLRDRFPGIKIISCSFSSQSWGDENVHKPEDVESGLPTAVKKVLSRPKRRRKHI